MGETLYIFAWGNNERRGELRGRTCRILIRGGKGTVLVEFLDTGERVTCSFRALRRSDRLETRQSERAETPDFEPSALVGSPSAPVDGTALSSSISLQIAGFFSDLTERLSHSQVRSLVATRPVGRALGAPAPGGTGPRSVSSSNAADPIGEALKPRSGETYPLSCRHRGDRRLSGAARPRCTFRNHRFAARLCAQTDDRPLAFGGGVAGVGRDRHAGIALGSMRVQPVAARLLVHRIGVMRDPAGESVPASVGGRPRRDVADAVRAGQVAHRVRRAPVRLTVAGARVPTHAQLVLNGRPA